MQPVFEQVLVTLYALGHFWADATKPESSQNKKANTITLKRFI